MTVAIIGGSGFGALDSFGISQNLIVDTPYGKPSADIVEGKLFDHEPNILFLARHGTKHTIQPHKINFRANLYALKELGVKKIIALGAVGGIDMPCEPGSLIVPDQILDYTHSREATFFDQSGEVVHAEFTEPYSAELRTIFIEIAKRLSIKIVNRGVCAVTQGPRLETAAEIQRLQRDGATIVGMTAMPEAILARELGIAYMSICFSVNWAAGIQTGLIEHDDIHAAYSVAARKLYLILKECLADIEKTTVNVPDVIRM